MKPIIAWNGVTAALACSFAFTGLHAQTMEITSPGLSFEPMAVEIGIPLSDGETSLGRSAVRSGTRSVTGACSRYRQEARDFDQFVLPNETRTNGIAFWEFNTSSGLVALTNFTATEVTVYALDCPALLDGDTDAWQALTPEPIPLNGFERPANPDTFYTLDDRLLRWGDRVCLHARVGRERGLFCAQLDDDEPSFERWDLAEELALQMPADVRLRAQAAHNIAEPPTPPEFYSNPPHDVFLRALEPLEDGNAIALIRYQVGGHQGDAIVLRLVEVDANGALVRWYREAVGLIDGPIAFDETLQAILYPAYGLSHSTDRELIGSDGGNPVYAPIGWHGSGIGVIRRDEPDRVGWIPLANIDMPLPDGTLDTFTRDDEFHVHDAARRIIRVENIDPARGTWAEFYVRLQIDPGAVDLDADGLDADAEATLGTSDLSADTDRDGRGDALEADLGTDPGEDDGFTARSVRESRTWVPSSWALWRMPWLAPGRFVRAAGPNGPMCVAGHGNCYGRDGQIVFSFGEDLREDAVVSQDGRWLWGHDDDETVWRVSLETGEWGASIEAAVIEGALATDNSNHAVLWPIDGDHAFLWHDPAQRALEIRGDSVEVVFDFAALRCVGTPQRVCDHAHGLQIWGGQRLVDARAIALQPGTGRLLMHIRGHLDSFIVAVGGGEPLTVVTTARAMSRRLEFPRATDLLGNWHIPGYMAAPLPDLLLPTRDALLGPYFAYDPWMTPEVGTPFQPGLGSSPVAVADGTNVGTFWGDTTVRRDAMEWVETSGAVEPGDVLWMFEIELPVSAFHAARGWMLAKIPGRGGALALWEQPLQGLTAVTGMDMNLRGELCVADRGGSSVHILAPQDETGIPFPTDYSLSDVDAIDCAWAEDGRVYVLDGARQRVVLWRTGSSEVETTSATEPGRIPLRLHRVGGDLVVLYSDDTGPNGDRVLGVAVDSRTDTLIEVARSDLLAEISADAAIDAVLRPDGVLVGAVTQVSPAGASVSSVDREVPFGAVPNDSRAIPVTVDPLYPPQRFQALALVPGSFATDPGVVRQSLPDTEGTPTVFSAPVHPEGGVPDDRRSQGASSGCSASSAGGGGPGWIAGFLAVASLRRRRRSPN